MSDAPMYAVFFESRTYLHGKPVGSKIQLPCPDVIPANNDKEAINKAFGQAELVEHLKSFRVRNARRGEKLLIRVRTIIRKGEMDKVVLTPKYKKGEFKHRA